MWCARWTSRPPWIWSGCATSTNSRKPRSYREWRRRGGQAQQQPTLGRTVMQAITVSDREAGVAGLSLTDLPHPEAASNDVVVRVHAAGFIPTELDWPDTWTDRAGRDRTP